MLTLAQVPSSHVPDTPDVDGGAISLLPQQQFWRPVPQRDHLVRVQALVVFCVVQSTQTPVTQLYLTSAQHKQNNNNVFSLIKYNKTKENRNNHNHRIFFQ